MGWLLFFAVGVIIILIRYQLRDNEIQKDTPDLMRGHHSKNEMMEDLSNQIVEVVLEKIKGLIDMPEFKYQDEWSEHHWYKINQYIKFGLQVNKEGMYMDREAHGLNDEEIEIVVNNARSELSTLIKRAKFLGELDLD
ncbi:MAG: hypothetical protein HUJ22_02245 [Gracilimonas sp.]|uniref:hypothetical protein n=1 Tax=Gracilimonas sp. TaxID=1974203 RepID=UPI00199D3B65|nr:hypothetical protein [Gracilimonas sp.]MBD3615365.1 hypothetical protein [Gracilimonas sp.]